MIDYSRVEHLVRQAGQMILDAHITEDQVHTKGSPYNFVTEYDVRIQQYLIENLRRIVPDAVFYGEESTDGNAGQGTDQGFCFYIDPIDGTTNFVHGYKHSCVSVGIGLDGRIIAGFVYNPYLNEMYKAIRGQGAYLNDKRLWTENRRLTDGIVALGIPGDAALADYFFKIMRQLYDSCQKLRDGGSAALDLCRVASGSNVAFIQMHLYPYDYAAASVIIEEAGGMISQLNGENVSLSEPCFVLAGAPVSYVQMRNIVLRINEE